MNALELSELVRLRDGQKKDDLKQFYGGISGILSLVKVDPKKGIYDRVKNIRDISEISKEFERFSGLFG